MERKLLIIARVVIAIALFPSILLGESLLRNDAKQDAPTSGEENKNRFSISAPPLVEWGWGYDREITENIWFATGWSGFYRAYYNDNYLNIRFTGYYVGGKYFFKPQENAMFLQLDLTHMSYTAEEKLFGKRIDRSQFGLNLNIGWSAPPKKKFFAYEGGIGLYWFNGFGEIDLSGGGTGDLGYYDRFHLNLYGKFVWAF